MNNHFNIKRFGMLFKKHTIEHYKSYLMSWVVMIGVIALFTEFIIYSNGKAMSQMDISPLPIKSQWVIFILFILLAGAIFTSTVFTNFSDKKRSITSLTLPASHLEKFLVVWIYSFVIFQLVFLLSFYITIVPILSLHTVNGKEVELLNIFKTHNHEYLIIPVYALLHGIALLGAIFFEKLHFIKTAFALCVIILLLSMINRQLLDVLFDRSVESATLFKNVSYIEKNSRISIGIPDSKYALLLIPLIIMTIIFWVSAFFGLKEKQA